MSSRIIGAVHGVRRSFVAAIITAAAALLLPLSAGAKVMQDLPAGHWAYAALSKVTGVSIFQQLQEISYTPAQTRTRYELAMLVRKALVSLDAATFAAPAPELPIEVRVPLRTEGLQHQLAALEEIYTAMTHASDRAAKKVHDVLSEELPEVRGQVKELATEAAALPMSLSSTGNQSSQKLTGMEEKVDALLTKMQAIRLHASSLAEEAYARAWSHAAPTVLKTLADNVAASGNADDPQKTAADTLETLAGLQREFAQELQALDPVQHISINPLLSQFVSASDQAIPHTVLDAPWQIDIPAEQKSRLPARISAGRSSQAIIAPSQLSRSARKAITSSIVGSTDVQKIGADYRIDLFGTKLQTGLALERQAEEDSHTLTKRVTAQAPLGDIASVRARVELVDIDLLRNLAFSSGVSQENASNNSSKQAKFGVDGSVKLGESGSFRIGYELTKTQDTTGSSLSAAADAGVEYNLTDRTKLAAGYNLDADAQGTKATTNFDLGYNITRDSSLSARYELINFDDTDSPILTANAAQAELTVRF